MINKRLQRQRSKDSQDHTSWYGADSGRYWKRQLAKARRRYWKFPENHKRGLYH
jgi:hypothetical protein